MGEPKAFASLSSGLLARKGAARPAMRPQGFGQSGAGLEDLGWNDMGFEPPKAAVAPVRDADHDAFGDELPEPALRNPLAALTPVASPVHDQQAEIADRFAGYTDEPGDDEDYDDTAELYDPTAEDAVELVAEPAEEPAAERDGPVLSIKPNKVAAIIAAVPVAAPVVRAAPVVPDLPVAQVAPARAIQSRAAPGSKAKAAFTLRLDAQRHLKLRLACAVTGRSAQQLVTDALDQLLKSMPELDTMAERAPKRRAS